MRGQTAPERRQELMVDRTRLMILRQSRLARSLEQMIEILKEGVGAVHTGCARGRHQTLGVTFRRDLEVLGALTHQHRTCDLRDEVLGAIVEKLLQPGRGPKHGQHVIRNLYRLPWRAGSRKPDCIAQSLEL